MISRRLVHNISLLRLTTLQLQYPKHRYKYVKFYTAFVKL
jgi:hypothetical protein